MVRITSALLFLTAIVSAVAYPGNVEKRCAEDVAAALANVTIAVNKLDADLTNFPASGISGALGVHKDAVSVNSLIISATNATISSPAFSEVDGTSIIESIEAVAPTIEDALSQIIAKKADFTAIPVGGIPKVVKGDINTLYNSTSALADALIAKAPADLLDRANALKTNMTTSFDAAVAAYADV